MSRVFNLSSLEKEAIGYGEYVAGDDGQSNSREDVGIVALARMEHLPLVGHGVERTAARKHATTLGELKKGLQALGNMPIISNQDSDFVEIKLNV